MENETVYVDDMLNDRIGLLYEELSKTETGSKEEKKLSDDLFRTIALKHEYEKLDDEKKEKVKSSRFERIKFVVQTFISVLGIAIPTALALAMLRFSNSGDYQTADEAKVFGWLFNMAKPK